MGKGGGQVISGPEITCPPPFPIPPEEREIRKRAMILALKVNEAQKEAQVSDTQLMNDRDAKLLNERLTSSFGLFGVVRAGEGGGEWEDQLDGAPLGDRVYVHCFIQAGSATLNECDVWGHTMAFPHPFIRFVPWPEGPHGAFSDDISSTSAAPNGKFFTIFDVCEAIGKSLNIWPEGSPPASCDLRLNCLASIMSFKGMGTIWDLTPPDRDPVPTMPKMVTCLDKEFAFAMGLHPRLGAQASPKQKIGPARSRLFACR